MQIVTGYTGTEHVSSAMDGAQNAGIIGTGQYVLATGNQLKATMQTSNTVRVLDGDVMINGRHGYIAAGSYDDLTIESGTSGYNRNDLVVARYTVNASTSVEAISLVVIKGTPTTGTAADPSYNGGSVLSGGTTVDMPLWRIPLTGISAGTPVQMFSVAPSLTTVPMHSDYAVFTGVSIASGGHGKHMLTPTIPAGYTIRSIEIVDPQFADQMIYSCSLADSGTHVYVMAKNEYMAALAANATARIWFERA